MPPKKCLSRIRCGPVILLFLLLGASAFAISDFKIVTHLYVNAVGLDESLVSAVPPAEGNWFVDNVYGRATSGGYVAWGRTRANLSLAVNRSNSDPDPPLWYSGGADITSTWTETCTISGGSGTGKGAFFLSVEASEPPVGQEYNWIAFMGKDGAPLLQRLTGMAGVYEVFFDFVYGQPFDLQMFVGANQSWSNAGGGRTMALGAVEMEIKKVLLPVGAVLNSVTPIPADVVMHPSLSIRRDGSDAVLHWIGSSSSSVESAAELSGPAGWGGQGGTQYPLGVFEYEMVVPMGSDERRFFRIVSGFGV